MSDALLNVKKGILKVAIWSPLIAASSFFILTFELALMVCGFTFGAAILLLFSADLIEDARIIFRFDGGTSKKLRAIAVVRFLFFIVLILSYLILEFPKWFG